MKDKLLNSNLFFWDQEEMSQIAVSRENSIGNFSIPDTQSYNNNNNNNVNIPEEKQDEQSKSAKSQPPVPQGIAAPPIWDI